MAWKFVTKSTNLNNRNGVNTTMRKRNYLVYKNRPTRLYLWLLGMEKKYNRFNRLDRLSKVR